MEYRRLGRSGLFVSTMTLGTMTFGGRGDFSAVGSTDAATATRQVDMCLDAGINLFDTADIYSGGESEDILGQAISGRRDRVLLATKARMPAGEGPNEAGLSRQHLIRQCEASLRRLGTDYIDLYQTHEWDGVTPLEETLEALDTLVRSGKVRYVGCSNHSGWQLMKALGVSDRLGLQRYVSQHPPVPPCSWSVARTVRGPGRRGASCSRTRGGSARGGWPAREPARAHTSRWCGRSCLGSRR